MVEEKVAVVVEDMDFVAMAMVKVAMRGAMTIFMVVAMEVVVVVLALSVVKVYMTRNY